MADSSSDKGKQRPSKKADISADGEDLDDSGPNLVISLTPQKPIINDRVLRKSARKRKRPPSDEDEESIDKSFEENLQDCAKRNNLTSIEMKKILRKLVGNDHVLAVVKLQEEAELAQELLNEENSIDTQLDDIKLTRAKARALNKKPIPLAPLIETSPEPEVAALISQELHSDEEDEEYDPRNEEYPSDDDRNTTASDFDSQPCTPMTPASQIEQTEQFTPDGLFKLPRERYDSSASLPEEIIAKRTRSKVCLQATAIETIESSFVPPDIPNDMYDLDVEMDNNWKEFLNEFTKPLNTNTEEDDEADPEYVAEREKVDSEELKDINISKKELSDLVAELFDGLISEGVLLEDIEVPKKSPERSPQKKRLKPIEEEPIVSQKQTQNQNLFLPVVTSTPCPAPRTTQNDVNAFPVTPIVTTLPQSQSPSIYKRNHTKAYIYTPEGYKALTEVIKDPVKSLETLPVVYSESTNTLVPLEPIKITHPPQTIDLNNVSSYQLVIPPQPVQTATSPINPIHPVNNSIISHIPTAPAYPSATNATIQSAAKSINSQQKTKWERTSKYMETAKRYTNLQNIHVPDPTFTEADKGFTEYHRQILNQQMRMHVQFAAQNFFQVYSNPEFYMYAEREKNMLLELDKMSKMDEKSAFNAWNLKPAIKLINEWEAELSINNADNTEFIEFINKEIEKAKKKFKDIQYVMKFPPRLMKRILKSSVFMYPELLPKVPFRVDLNNFNHVASEDHLLAHYLYYTNKEMLERDKHKRTNKSKPISVGKLCERIVRDVVTYYSADELRTYIKYRMNGKTYNPLKYYDEFKKPPPFEHILHDVDLKNVLAPEFRVLELPPVWGELANRLRGLELERVQGPINQDLNITRADDAVFPPTAIRYQPKYRKSVKNTQVASNVVIHFNYVFDKANSPNLSNLQLSPVQKFVCSGCVEETLSTSDGTVVRSREKNLSQADFSEIYAQIEEPLTKANQLRTKLQLHKLNEFLAPIDNPDKALARSTPNIEEDLSIITPPRPTISFDGTQTTCQSTSILNTSHNENDGSNTTLLKGQKLLTDYFTPKEETTNKLTQNHRKLLKIRKKLIRTHRKKHRFLTRKLFKAAANNRRDRTLKRKLQTLVLSYRVCYNSVCNQYKDKNLKFIFLHIKALEYYTELLIDLKMNVKKIKMTTCAEEMPSKKQKIGGVVDEDNPKPEKTRKPYRVGESLRQMLLPESKEDANEKDAVYALNFYEKVEEIYNKSKKPEEFKKFQKILKSFDPQKDKVADLYYKMEKLFLPDHAELAEIFLTFLLPSEAIEIGKFFEHFMLTNMGTFISKLSVFFTKQPAQVKKIYSALNELAEEKDLTMEKIKEKIMPLLKGNKFLTDWFMQIFPSEKPPQSLSTVYETINFKQLESHLEAEAYESLQQKDLLDDSFENHPCQMKYINGQIFYGSRVLLPAKLSFLATELAKTADNEAQQVHKLDSRLPEIPMTCVHGIRDYAEKRLKDHLDKSDEGKIEEEQQQDKQTYILCDDYTFKAHASRLNPALYPPSPSNHNTQLNKSKTSDPNARRRSPKKNLPKSPITKKSPTQAPEMPITKALGMAKKLKSLTAGDSVEQNKPKRKQQKPLKSTISIDQQIDTEIINISSSSSNRSITDDDKNSIELKRAQQKQQKTLQQLPLLIDDTGDENEISINQQKPIVWTRDEDKLILEEVKSGFDNEISLVSRLVMKLSNRTEEEIATRHQFLMAVLTQLQSKG